MCRSFWRLAYLCTTVAVLLVLVGACSNSSRDASQFLTAEQLEAEAQSLDESLICPSCPGKTIGQSQVAQAAQMRELVREKLAEGWSRQEILDYFAERYEGVLAEPPKEGFTLLAWVLPLVGILGGGTALYLVLRAMLRRPDRRDPDTDLEQYMDRVDRDLGRPPSDASAVVPPTDGGDV